MGRNRGAADISTLEGSYSSSATSEYRDEKTTVGSTITASSPQASEQSTSSGASTSDARDIHLDNMTREQLQAALGQAMREVTAYRQYGQDPDLQRNARFSTIDTAPPGYEEP
jgi:hypothetical protein